MALAVAAMFAPQKPPNGRNFNCHGAVVYWAGIANGLTPARAYALYDAIATSINPRGIVANASIEARAYGGAFCGGAIAVTIPGINAAEFAVGDVVIFPYRENPMHSMVCVSTMGGTVTVRGYNNHNTFIADVPQPPGNAYDTNNRNLANRTVRICQLFRIPENTFLLQIRNRQRLFRI